jgi:hypothetical protein
MGFSLRLLVAISTAVDDVVIHLNIKVKSLLVLEDVRSPKAPIDGV